MEDLKMENSLRYVHFKHVTGFKEVRHACYSIDQAVFIASDIYRNHRPQDIEYLYITRYDGDNVERVVKNYI